MYQTEIPARMTGRTEIFAGTMDLMEIPEILDGTTETLLRLVILEIHARILTPMENRVIPALAMGSMEIPAGMIVHMEIIEIPKGTMAQTETPVGIMDQVEIPGTAMVQIEILEILVGTIGPTETNRNENSCWNDGSNRNYGRSCYN